ncbi:MAG: DUF2179 domain-containing protein, partial [Candidatus Omnitrophica bacterium]|nr:DUF2179 domain-containing protein [Candidatus Omnitrophota bacterium]
KRSELPKVKTIIYQYNPQAFYTVEDVKSINELTDAQEKRGLFHGMIRK